MLTRSIAIASLVALLAPPVLAVRLRQPALESVDTVQEPIAPESLEDIAKKFQVTLHTPVGRSRCKEDRKCVGIIMLAARIEDDIPDGTPVPEGEACPEFGEGSTESACNFLCGTMANVAHHTQRLRELESNTYSFDVVLMHDVSLPAKSLTMMQSLGARTILFDDSIKRRACHAFVDANPDMHFAHMSTKALNHTTCEEAPLDHINFNHAHLMMFLQQLKLGAIGLTEYDAVAHLDIDMFVTNESSLASELDYYFANDMELMAQMGKISPLNAGHWVARPSTTTFNLWLQAITQDGFREDDGWGHVGAVVPHIWEALPRNKKIVPAGDWSFVGADRDQGLLYYIFALKLNGWYAEAANTHSFSVTKRDLKFNESSKVKFTAASFGEYDIEGIQHMCGIGKPWDSQACARPDVDCKRKTQLNALLPGIVSALQGLKDGGTSAFVSDFCYPRLADNVQTCAVEVLNC